jgi:hypothetical protein
MSDSLIGNANNKDNKDVCAVCRETLPAGVAFCPHCGPPNPPEDEPDEGMGTGQTFFRIFLILILFGAIAIFKLDISLTDDSEEIVPSESITKSSVGTDAEKPHILDFETISKITADKSRVRKEPSKDGKILTVLKKGTKVKILDNNEDWWKIVADGESGWISKDDMNVQVR